MFSLPPFQYVSDYFLRPAQFASVQQFARRGDCEVKKEGIYLLCVYLFDDLVSKLIYKLSYFTHARTFDVLIRVNVLVYSILLKHLKESVEDKRRSNTKSLSIIYIRHIVRNKMIVFQGCNDVIRDTLYEWS